MNTPILEVIDAMIEAMEPIAGEVDGLQFFHAIGVNPTPPYIDVYLDTPSQTSSGFGGDTQYFFLVRARTTTADHEAGQLALYRFVDKNDPASVQVALEADQSLGGRVQSIAVLDEGVSGLTEYLDDAHIGGKLIGIQLRVGVIV